jgi:hypothetical protein
MNLLPGSHRLTANGAVGVSGGPVRVFGIHTVSLTAATIGLHNGTTSGGTQYVMFPGSANTGATVNFEGGLLFPSGCYLTCDANLSHAVVIASVEPA